MFGLAMEARKRDAGVVGSTQNILDFIAAKLNDALQRSFPERVQVCHVLLQPVNALLYHLSACP